MAGPVYGCSIEFQVCKITHRTLLFILFTSELIWVISLEIAFKPLLLSFYSWTCKGSFSYILSSWKVYVSPSHALFPRLILLLWAIWGHAKSFYLLDTLYISLIIFTISCLKFLFDIGKWLFTFICPCKRLEIISLVHFVFMSLLWSRFLWLFENMW